VVESSIDGFCLILKSPVQHTASVVFSSVRTDDEGLGFLSGWGIWVGYLLFSGGCPADNFEVGLSEPFLEDGLLLSPENVCFVEVD
jgi:hypothetical protein